MLSARRQRCPHALRHAVTASSRADKLPELKKQLMDIIEVLDGKPGFPPEALPLLQQIDYIVDEIGAPEVCECTSLWLAAGCKAEFTPAQWVLVGMTLAAAVMRAHLIAESSPGRQRLPRPRRPESPSVASAVWRRGNPMVGGTDSAHALPCKTTYQRLFRSSCSMLQITAEGIRGRFGQGLSNTTNVDAEGKLTLGILTFNQYHPKDLKVRCLLGSFQGCGSLMLPALPTFNQCHYSKV